MSPAGNYQASATVHGRSLPVQGSSPYREYKFCGLRIVTQPTGLVKVLVYAR